MDVFLTVLKFILPIIIALAAAKLVDRAFDKAKLTNRIHLVLLRSLILTLIWAIAITASLSNIPGISKAWQALLAGSGIVAVIIGLAAQETFSNVFAGFAISASMVSRPFEVGDRVQIGDIGPGYIRDMTLRHVVLETYDRQKIFIPNSVVGKSVIINYTQMPGYMAPIQIAVAYDAPLEKAMEIMEDVILKHPNHFKGAAAGVRIDKTLDSGILLRGLVSTPKVEDSFKACSDCYLEIIHRFAAEGIEIPYNKLELLQKTDIRENQ